MNATLAAIAVAAIAGIVYLILTLVAGARMTVGRLAADRLADEARLPEGFEPGSRSWLAQEVARQVCLVTAALAGAAAAEDERISLAFGASIAAGLIVAGRLGGSLIAPRMPEAILRHLGPAARLADLVLGVLIAPAARAQEALASRHRRARSSDEEGREEQLEEYIRDGEEEGILEGEESQLLREIVDFGDTIAREVMTPRTEMDAVPADADLDALRRAFVRSRHSRLPVYDTTLDHIVGVVSVRDLIAALDAAESHTRARDLLRPVLQVPGSKRVAELLRELQRARQQLAIVIDEHGGTAGLVTIEDLLEEIVGEIRDEHESDDEPAVAAEDGTYVVDGLMVIEDLEQLLGRDVPDDDGVETVGGLVLSRLGRMPRVGDRVDVGGDLALEVVETDGRRVARVRVRPAGGGGDSAPRREALS